jgi:hypothetical protein
MCQRFIVSCVTHALAQSRGRRILGLAIGCVDDEGVVRNLVSASVASVPCGLLIAAPRYAGRRTLSIAALFLRCAEAAARLQNVAEVALSSFATPGEIVATRRRVHRPRVRKSTVHRI